VVAAADATSPAFRGYRTLVTEEPEYVVVWVGDCSH
jgi:hypothetical protein